MKIRSILLAVFHDSETAFHTDPDLSAAVARSCEGTRCNASGSLFPDRPEKAGRVSVSQGRTYEAAMHLAKTYPGKRVAVLDFASATRPGGNVRGGGRTQEDNLCRGSTLLPTLEQESMPDAYYRVNQADSNVLHTDA